MLEGFPILKSLYAKDLPDSIRVRALVGLCKMGSSNAGAPNMKNFADGAVINLAKKLRPFLVGKAISDDVRRWAAEGIAFLSLDADVKEYVTLHLAFVSRPAIGFRRPAKSVAFRSYPIIASVARDSHRGRCCSRLRSGCCARAVGDVVPASISCAT